MCVYVSYLSIFYFCFVDDKIIQTTDEVEHENHVRIFFFECISNQSHIHTHN